MVAVYVTKSPARGVYSYRRRVPSKLRALWGQREVKKSLETKNYSEALARASKVNQNFEAKKEYLSRKLNGEDTNATPEQVWFTLREASAFLQKYGLHPDQAPVPGVATRDEVEEYERLVEVFHDNYVDQKEIDIDPVTWERSYRPDSATDKWDQAKAILEGKKHHSVEPTLADALAMYLTLNQEKAQRTPHNKRKFEEANRRASDRLAQFLGNGSKALGYEIKLSTLSRIQLRKFRDFLRSSNPSWSTATLNKDIQRLQAICRLASREYELELPNHFSGLQLAISKQDTRPRRRSFTPNELAQYKKALGTKSDEIRLVGMLMIATGARTMEIAGLTFGDLALDSNVPHIRIRYNHIRKLKSDASERDVPVVGAALDLLQNYTSLRANKNPVAPVFPSYGRDGGMDAASQLLNKVIRKDLRIEDKSLVAYSSRHTMKDKLRAIRTPVDLQHAILGHSSDNRVAEGYGTGNPLKLLQDELLQAEQVEDWGQ